MIPFYIFYSMFGFQRVGDMIWACGDMMCKGFLLGGTSGRTTLNGEGVQHQDGHSHLLASTVPNLKSYDPAFAFEIAVIVRDGIRRMYAEQRTSSTTSPSPTELPQPAMPDADGGSRLCWRHVLLQRAGRRCVNLFGSGAIMTEVLRAGRAARASGLSAATSGASPATPSSPARPGGGAARAARGWRGAAPEPARLVGRC
jgi:pyruvate dehydrogenase E1 component